MRSCTVGFDELALVTSGEPKKGLSFLDAAEQLLRIHGNSQPMHYQEIARLAVEQGLVITQGRTPAATLNAQIGVEIGRRRARGEQQRFTRYPRGLVGLAMQVEQGLASDIERQNQSVRRQLHERLLHLSPSEFEGLIGRLLGSIGFQDVIVTGRSGDGGIDVRGTLVVGDVIRTRMAVQAKRWRANVQAPVVQQVRGSLGTHDQGLIITTSNFSSGALTEAERANAVPVALMNGAQLVSLLIEHEIGVRRVPHFLIELEARDIEAQAVADDGVEAPEASEASTSIIDQPRFEPDLSTKAGSRRSTIRLTTKVEDDKLLVSFADGTARSWALPPRADKNAIRSVRTAAIEFAHGHGTTPGQENAIRKALTSAGYHLTR